MQLSRLVRRCVGLFCLAVLIYQVYHSFEQLQGDDILTIAKSVPQHSFVVPGIEICSDVALSLDTGVPSTMEQVYASVGQFNDTIIGVYFGMIYEASEKVTFSEVQPKNMELFDRYVYPMRPPLGPQYAQVHCFTYSPKNLTTQIGARFGVTLFVNVSQSLPTGYQLVYVSEPKQNTFGDHTYFGGDFKVVDIKAMSKADPTVMRHYVVNVDRTTRHKLSIPGKYECTDGGTDTVMACLEQHYDSKLRCRSPFGKNTALPVCSTAGHLDQFEQIINRTLNSDDASVFMEEMGCALPCSRQEYQMSVIAEYNGHCMFTDGCQHVLALQFISKADHVDVVVEKWLYDQNNFIADVGGYMGLLLGASILNIYDHLYDVVVRIKEKYMKWKA